MEGAQPRVDLALLADAELIARAQQGTAEERQESIDQLAKRHEQVAKKSAMAILHDEDAANDVVQETSVTLLLWIDRLDARPLDSWIATVARRAALDWRRKGRRLIFFSDGLPTDCDEPEDSSTPYNHARHKEVLAALKTLPLKQQVVIERVILGDDVADIAADLRLTPAAVYDRLKKAREALHRILDYDEK